ncbi:hypothetical protein SAMN04488023_12012 [Pedobacter rhizosphaerae]|uniref:Uncharacterized protein n=1 Tax=Pedobacter rhizosphaerae TaxID=390241 RepID=A0A1H9SYW2_9SPHI|nr:hypothetical protein SAMN04488023_12012 [Pedobacter rhizosphaerae]
MARTLDQIKWNTITVLLNDEILMALLVLKDGNAIDLLYDLSNGDSNRINVKCTVLNLPAQNMTQYTVPK